MHFRLSPILCLELGWMNGETMGWIGVFALHRDILYILVSLSKQTKEIRVRRVSSGSHACIRLVHFSFNIFKPVLSTKQGER